ncbi:MAG: pirin family protein [Nocardioides sp.]
MTTEIRRGSERFVEREPGRLTRHSMSFGASYDPENLRFGAMVCHDDHLLGQGNGFETHHHSGLDIVTWVVSGAVRHADATGAEHVVEADSVAVLHTGAGVDHSEFAAAPQTRFVQVWLTPDDDAPDEPSYAVTPITPVEGELTPVTTLPGGTFSIARLGEGETFTLPAAPLVHVYVARGALVRAGLAEPLHEGDAYRFTDEPGHAVTTGVPTDLLIWTLD